MALTAKPKMKFFLAESQGFIMCIDKVDMLVADVATIGVGDKVKFKYGAETYNGVVTFMSASEEEALKEMKVQSKVKRSNVRSSSEGVSNKRMRHRVVPDEDVCKLVDPTSQSKQSKSNARLVQKKKKERAEFILDDELMGVPVSNNTDQGSESENIIHSAGSSISISDSDDDPPLTKKHGRTQDVRKIAGIYSDSDTDQDIPTKASKAVAVKDGNNNMKTKGKIKITKKSDNIDRANEVVSDQTDQCYKAVRGTENGGKSSGSDVGTLETSLQPETVNQEEGKSKRCDQDSGNMETSQEKIIKKSTIKIEGKVKRNRKIYVGSEDTYLYSENTPNAVKIHPSYDVFTLKNILDRALHNSKSASICCRTLLDNVYSEEALAHSSAFGFPPRGKGSNITQDQVLPRLDPKGIEAILARALEHQITYKTWRPKMTEGQLRSSITNKVSLAKRAYQARLECESSEEV